jgi:hypothetical protein
MLFPIKTLAVSSPAVDRMTAEVLTVAVLTKTCHDVVDKAGCKCAPPAKQDNMAK